MELYRGAGKSRRGTPVCTNRTGFHWLTVPGMKYLRIKGCFRNFT